MANTEGLKQPEVKTLFEGARKNSALATEIYDLLGISSEEETDKDKQGNLNNLLALQGVMWQTNGLLHKIVEALAILGGN